MIDICVILGNSWTFLMIILLTIKQWFTKKLKFCKLENVPQFKNGILCKETLKIRQWGGDENIEQIKASMPFSQEML